MVRGVELHEPGDETRALGAERFWALVELAACERPTAAAFEAARRASGAANPAFDGNGAAEALRPGISGKRQLLNQLRAVLLERGSTAPQRRHKLGQTPAALLDDASGEDARGALSPRVCALLEDMRAESSELDRRVGAYDEEFAARAKSDGAARRLATVPGIGPLNATALAAAVGDGAAFARGRDLAARLGPAPRRATTGGRPTLLGTGKRGNKRLHKPLVHGARSAMPSLSRSATPLGAWLRGLVGRAHKNAATAALANKLARIAWAALRGGERFGAAMPAAAQGLGRARARWPGAAVRCLRAVEARWPDGRTGALASRAQKWRLDAGAFMRARARGSPSWPGCLPRDRMRRRRLPRPGRKSRLQTGRVIRF